MWLLCPIIQLVNLEFPGQIINWHMSGNILKWDQKSVSPMNETIHTVGIYG